MALKFDKLKLAGLKVVQFGKHEYRKRGGYYGSNRSWRLSRTEFTSPSHDNHSRHGGNTFLYPNDHYNVFIRDTNSKPVARMKLYVEENEFPTLLVIEDFFGRSTEATIKNAALALGISESSISKMSDMEAPAVTSNGTPAGKRARGYQYRKGQDTYNSKGWEPVMDLDDLGMAVYVGMERHSVIMDDGAREVMIMACDEQFNFPVVAVNQQTFKRIQNGKVGTNLITPTEALEPLRERINLLLPTYNRYLALNSFCTTIQNSKALCWMSKAKKDQVSSDIFVKVEKLRAKAKDIRESFKKYEYHLKQLVDVSIHRKATNKAEKAAEKLAKKVDAKYPMLQHLNTWDNGGKEDAINYINLVDSTC
jgi:hypothetical protein